MHLENIIQKHLGRLFPSAAVLYAQHGVVQVEQAFGTTLRHRFDVASLTKVCAATLAVLRLIEQNIFSLDDPASEWLPALRTPDKAAITVRHLLTHTSGLPAWRPLYCVTRVRNDVPAVIAHTPLDHSPGTHRCYSDLGFLLLGFLVEAVAHQRLDDYCAEQFYRPLGLADTGFRPQLTDEHFVPTSIGNPYEAALAAAQPQPRIFTDWRTTQICGAVNDGNAYYALQGIAGHAGLFSTAHDLFILSQMLLNHGRHNGLQILAPESIDTMLTPDVHGQGLGWWMAESLLGVTSLPMDGFAHFGFTGCFACASRTTQQILIVLTNRQQMGLQPNGKYPDLKPFVSELLRAIA